MKKYLVIGNPIKHSMSPKIHNYWFKKYKIKANYTKKKITNNQLKNLINKVRNKKIDGINITVPFKDKVIPFIDKLSKEARIANSVNTIYLSKNRVVGHNTDISGFCLSIKKKKLNLRKKNALILGSGGVTPSIIIGLKKLGIKKIIISNRSKDKALKLKEKFGFLDILDWGKTVKANIIINSTSLGLKKSDNIKIKYNIFEPRSIFYDLIYNPPETNFLKKAKKHSYIFQNGFMMFIYQAAEAFKTWHNIKPKVDKNLIQFLKND